MVRRWLMSAAVLVAVGCSQDPKVETADGPPKQAGRDFARLSAVLADLQRPAEIRLCEGLPSEFWEPELREQERARKETIDLHGYRFYKEWFPVQDSDAAELAGWLSSRKSYRAYRGGKTCGSYQPDYGLAWDRGTSTTHVLISLECGEVMIFGPRAELHCDLTREAAQKLESLLGRYRKNRPVETAGT